MARELKLKSLRREAFTINTTTNNSVFLVIEHRLGRIGLTKIPFPGLGLTFVQLYMRTKIGRLKEVFLEAKQWVQSYTSRAHVLRVRFYLMCQNLSISVINCLTKFTFHT